MTSSQAEAGLNGRRNSWGLTLCGIIGYVGSRDAIDVLMAGLASLTYRGYDSAGVAIADSGKIEVIKAAGKVSELAARMNGYRPAGTTGIGHTRWATHGEPSDANAHPHVDCQGDVAVVHNGIFENSESLRVRLINTGHTIRSQTDTELFAHLVENHYFGSLEDAVRAALAEVEGSFALVVVSRREPGKLIVAKLDVPPIVIGLGTADEVFVSSDVSSLVRFTNKVVYLEDGEMAILSPNSAKIDNFRVSTATNRRRPPSSRVVVVDMSPDVAERGGYDHFMLKEIEEQPKAIRDTLRDRLQADGRVVLPDFDLSPSLIRNARRIIFLGCGTAFHAGLVGRYLFESVLRIPVQTEIASEFRYRQPVIGPDDLVIAVSQSGETADTVSAVRQVQEAGAQVVAITNVVGSSIARLADHVLVTRAGPEIAVASTKAFTTQIVAIHLLLLYLAQFRQHGNEKPLQQLALGLRTLPEAVQQVVDQRDAIKRLGERLAQADDVYYIGRNLDEPIAREGSLKIKEISYIHSEAYAAGELKHGTLALLSPGTPVVALATQSDVYDKLKSNVQEVLARKAWVLGIVPEDDVELSDLVNERIALPRTNDLIAPVPAVVALQLLAYYCGVARGCDIDQPRNLAKSVTVE